MVSATLEEAEVKMQGRSENQQDKKATVPYPCRGVLCLARRTDMPWATATGAVDGLKQLTEIARIERHRNWQKQRAGETRCSLIEKGERREDDTVYDNSRTSAKRAVLRRNQNVRPKSNTVTT